MLKILIKYVEHSFLQFSIGTRMIFLSNLLRGLLPKHNAMSQLYSRNPEFKQLLLDIEEIQSRAYRDAKEVILDDLDLCKLLKISRRKSAEIRNKREIRYYKSGGKVYYFLSDVLEYIRRNAVPSVYELSKL